MFILVCEAREGAGPRELPRETGFAAGKAEKPDG